MDLSVNNKIIEYTLIDPKSKCCFLSDMIGMASDVRYTDDGLPIFTKDEWEWWKNWIDTEQDIKNAAADFLNMGVKNIIITLGEKGSYFANENEEYFINAFKLKNEVVDTTGAGDAFNGALAVALAKDFSYKDAILFANKVAGISTTRLGAAVSMPLLKKVEEY